MGNPFTETMQRIKRSAITAVALGLVVLVSGFLPILVQGYAWIDMARDAGGIQMIGEIVSDAEPCEICRAAQEMRENSRKDKDTPLPMERIELLKSISNEIPTVLAVSQEESESGQKWSLMLDSDRPVNCEFAPATPPPRILAA